MSNHKYFGMTEDEWNDHYKYDFDREPSKSGFLGDVFSKILIGQDFVKKDKKTIGQDFVPKEPTQVDGSHYENMQVQPWSVMESILSKEEFIGYLKGCIIKYSMRQGHKAISPKDGEKCHDYIRKLLEVEGKK